MSRQIMKYAVICRGYGHSNSESPTYYGAGKVYRNFTQDLADAFIYDTHKEAKDAVRTKLPLGAMAIPARVSNKELFTAKLKGGAHG